MEKSLLEHALEYAAHGYAVLPIYSLRNGCCTCQEGKDCSNPGKHPRTRNGVKDATTDTDPIEAWFTKWPKSNIAIRCGAQSGSVAVDVDPQNGGDQSLATLQAELGTLPECPEARTGGGGSHYFFKYPGAAVRTSHGTKLGPGIHFQADDTYVVVPPSRHASGKRYRWVPGRSLFEQAPPPLPKAYVRRLTESPRKDRPTQFDPIVDVIPEGQRNNALASLAGRLLNSGLSPSAMTAALLEENAHRCQPPLEPSEVAAIAASISRRAMTPARVEADSAETLARMVLDHRFAGGENLIFATDGQFWSFDRTHWSPLPRTALERIVLEAIPNMALRGSQRTASLMKQTVTLLQAARAMRDDVLRFLSPPPPVINCRNGELWVAEDGSVDLRRHQPRSYLRYCLEVDYDPHASCPIYDRTLREIFSCAAKPKALTRHFNELFGYILQPRRDIPLILVARGGGSNGKSLLFQTIGKLLGPELVSAIRIEQLDQNRFLTGNLLGKLLLIDDDVKSGVRLPDGELKKLSEAKPITGERKFGQPFNFTVLTVPVLLCNNPPTLADLTHGMRRRLMVLPFDRRFTEDEIDRNLFPRMWSSELSGILNRAISGLQRVVRRNWRFNSPDDVEGATAEWLIHANPLPAFLDAQCKQEGSCLMRDLYHAYEQWAQVAGITMKQQQLTVKRNLESLGYVVKHSNKGDKVVNLSLVRHAAYHGRVCIDSDESDDISFKNKKTTNSLRCK